MPSWKSLLVLGVGGAVAARMVARSHRRISVKGKTAIITGGARGLGLCIASELAWRGARVAICSRDDAQLQNARLQLNSIGDVYAASCDVTDPQSVAKFVNDVCGEFGPVDVLVNNAGMISVGPAEVMTRGDYEAALATHFWAPLNMIDAVVPEMRKRRRGRVVNIASIGGKIAVPHLLPYSASKFALVGLSEGLRAELMKDGIYVTTVCPGLVRTGSPRNATFKGQNEVEYAWFATGDTLPFLSIDPRELARKVVDALEAGDAELIAPWTTRVQTTLHGIFPGLSADLAAAANHFLPSPGGIGRRSLTGEQSRSSKTPARVQRAIDAAAGKLNEVRR